eukprot:1180854-Prorocentrum_minimum.AAC.3
MQSESRVDPSRRPRTRTYSIAHEAKGRRVIRRDPREPSNQSGDARARKPFRRTFTTHISRDILRSRPVSRQPISCPDHRNRPQNNREESRILQW